MWTVLKYKFICLWIQDVCVCVCVCRTSVLLTVAGDATSRSTGSKMRLICGDIWIISPLIRHSFLLSSSTVFMFSIHTASTGPSKISHFLSGLYWTQEELEFITIHLMWEKKNTIIISITSYLSDRFILTTADFLLFIFAICFCFMQYKIFEL